MTPRLFVLLLLCGWLAQGPAMAGVMLCPGDGGQIEIQGRIFDAVRVRVLEVDSGKEVAHFNVVDSPRPAWQAPEGARSCYTIQVQLTAAPNSEMECLANNNSIGYGVDAPAAFSVLLHYRNARLETRDTPCGVLPGYRDGTLAKPAPAPKPAETVGPDVPPAFAWPPPRPSTRRTLARHLVAGNVATPSLGRVAERLQAALEASGYTEYSYYSVPGGFALATRLERIHADGRSMTEPKRWEMAGGPLTRFELGEYLRALFDAELGHFRVIVFIVTPKALVVGTEPPSAAAALNWPLQGVPVLPEALRILAYDNAFQTHALIYEFETRGQGQPAQFKANSTITGEVHLRRANILGALQP